MSDVCIELLLLWKENKVYIWTAFFTAVPIAFYIYWRKFISNINEIIGLTVVKNSELTKTDLGLRAFVEMIYKDVCFVVIGYLVLSLIVPLMFILMLPHRLSYTVSWSENATALVIAVTSIMILLRTTARHYCYRKIIKRLKIREMFYKYEEQIYKLFCFLVYFITFVILFRWLKLLIARYIHKDTIIFRNQDLDRHILNTLNVLGETVNEAEIRPKVVSISQKRRWQNMNMPAWNVFARGGEDKEPVIPPDDGPRNRWFTSTGLKKAIQGEDKVIFGFWLQLNNRLYQLERQGLLDWGEEDLTESPPYEYGRPLYYITPAGVAEANRLNKLQNRT